MISKFIQYLSQLGLFIALAVLTQIGAITYLLSLVAANAAGLKRLSVRVGLNLGLYALFTFSIIPFIAPILGREPLIRSENLQPTNYWLTVGLNRHYVVPELNEVLESLSHQLTQQLPGKKLYYLDANFPFVDQYPLLPHLSHNDGRKIDLSYLYEAQSGEIVNLKPTRSGYGYFEEPLPSERNTTSHCKRQGYWQYDYPKYLTLGTASRNLNFSDTGNKLLMELVLSHNKVKKVFIEPHLVRRLGLKDDRLRFQGCGSVRHDDHIHLQI